MECGRRDADEAWEVKYGCYTTADGHFHHGGLVSALGTKSELICLLIFHNSADRSGGS